MRSPIRRNIATFEERATDNVFTLSEGRVIAFEVSSKDKPSIRKLANLDNNGGSFFHGKTTPRCRAIIVGIDNDKDGKPSVLRVLPLTFYDPEVYEENTPFNLMLAKHAHAPMGFDPEKVRARLCYKEIEIDLNGKDVEEILCMDKGGIICGGKADPRTRQTIQQHYEYLLQRQMNTSATQGRSRYADIIPYVGAEKNLARMSRADREFLEQEREKNKERAKQKNKDRRETQKATPSGKYALKLKRIFNDNANPDITLEEALKIKNDDGTQRLISEDTALFFLELSDQLGEPVETLRDCFDLMRDPVALTFLRRAYMAHSGLSVANMLDKDLHILMANSVSEDEKGYSVGDPVLGLKDPAMLDLEEAVSLGLINQETVDTIYTISEELQEDDIEFEPDVLGDIFDFIDRLKNLDEQSAADFLFPDNRKGKSNTRKLVQSVEACQLKVNALNGKRNEALEKIDKGLSLFTEDVQTGLKTFFEDINAKGEPVREQGLYSIDGKSVEIIHRKFGA